MDSRLTEQIKRLEKENKKLREQLEKVQRNSEYFRKSTTDYIKANEEQKQLMFRKFKKFLEKTMTKPKTIYDESLKYFYLYIVEHLELKQLQKNIRNRTSK